MEVIVEEERANGFYWILAYGHWQPARWRNGRWFLCGMPGPCNPAEVERVGANIEVPECAHEQPPG